MNICKNRDQALMLVGACTYKTNPMASKLPSFTENFEPAFEGPEEYRSLPYIEFKRKENHNTRIHYKK